MKRRWIFLVSISLVLAGCTPNNNDVVSEKEINVVSEKEINDTKTRENNQEPTIDRHYEFTYLEDLSKDKLELYNQFMSNGDIRILQDFTPEEIVLIYLNLVYEYEIGRLYSLTYDGGKLPSSEIFIDEYYEYLSSELENDYLVYRYYDSITVDTENSTKNMTVTKIEIIFGKTIYGKTFVLKQENNIWKVDLYHVIEELKKEK
jgi:hypothetical protein